MTGNYSWRCKSVKRSLLPPLLLRAAPPVCLTFDRHFFRVQAERCWQFVGVSGQKLDMWPVQVRMNLEIKMEGGENVREVEGVRQQL